MARSGVPGCAEGKEMRRCLRKMPVTGAAAAAVLALVIALFSQPVRAETNGKKTVLVHVNTIPREGKDQFFSIPYLALEILKRNHRMIILFDGRAAKLARIGHWYGGDTTILDKIEIEDHELKELARKMGLSVDSMPDNYGNLLRMLRGRGVELYVNHDAMRRLGIDDDEYDTAIVPVDAKQMLDLLEAADIYISY
jgi:hypothetical protein